MDKRLVPTRGQPAEAGQHGGQDKGSQSGVDSAATAMLWFVVCCLVLVNAFLLISRLTLLGVFVAVECRPHDPCTKHDVEYDPTEDLLILGAVGIPIIAGAANLVAVLASRALAKRGYGWRWPIFVWPLLAIAIQVMCLGRVLG